MGTAGLLTAIVQEDGIEVGKMKSWCLEGPAFCHDLAAIEADTKYLRSS
jgi:hypothetical protein